MLISISLAMLKEAEIVGRDRIRIGDLTFRVTDWDRKNTRLMLEPATRAVLADGPASDPGSATDE